MFSHIIENSILVRTLRNIWKHHITRLTKTDTKLQPCYKKFMAQKGWIEPLLHMN